MTAKRVVALIAFSVLATAQADLTNGLVAYYPFNGNAEDESGNGFTGVINNAVLTTDRFGAAAGAYWFNGTNAYINVGNQPAFNFAGDFTLSAWIYMSQAQTDRYILGKYF